MKKKVAFNSLITWVEKNSSWLEGPTSKGENSMYLIDLFQNNTIFS